MPDPSPPEPVRSTFDSEEEYSHAWMAWAQATPGGWRARMAERATMRIYIEWLDGPARVPSPCCERDVIIEPGGRTGLCPGCATLLRFTGARWRRRAG